MEEHRPKPEIPEVEVTPEMIEAGIAAISKWADYDEMVAEVYTAMERVRRANLEHR